MYYQICPRCQFRSPASKHICATCGKPLPKESAEKPKDSAASRLANNRPQKPSLWKSLFGISDSTDVTAEKAHDEPALGEA
jgi:predicted amidophosphoribosyltransferase